MAEFSDYVESRTAAGSIDGTEIMAGSKGGVARRWTTQQVADLASGVEHFRGGFSLAGNAYPTTGGTGAGNIPAAGDLWHVTVQGIIDVTGLGSTTIFPGATLLYIGGTVTLASSWIVKQ